MFHSSTIGCWS